MKIANKLIYLLIFIFVWNEIAHASYMFDMTQDRPINGLMPVPDQIYLPTGNLPSLKKCHCPCHTKARRARFGMRGLKEQYALEELCRVCKKPGTSCQALQKK